MDLQRSIRRAFYKPKYAKNIKSHKVAALITATTLLLAGSVMAPTHAL